MSSLPTDILHRINSPSRRCRKTSLSRRACCNDASNSSIIRLSTRAFQPSMPPDLETICLIALADLEPRGCRRERLVQELHPPPCIDLVPRSRVG